jgi:hypothetical protein
MERPDACCYKIIKLLPRWDKCYSAPRDNVQKLYFHGVSVAFNVMNSNLIGMTYRTSLIEHPPYPTHC